jgi:Leucine-rich repeat (LRR) protein
LNEFDNMTELNLRNTEIKKLELKSLPKLQKLNLSGFSKLSEVNLNEFDNLTELNLRNTKIKKLELRSLPKLKKLNLSGC